MASLIGQALGRYHILEPLGEGGMAVVYKAFDTRLERKVAIKVILPYRSHAEGFLKRFQREARALASLAHPNILKIFDFGEHDGLPYLVMEYLPGGTLRQKLSGQSLPWAESARLLAKVARALEAAHKQGIIHRDVKPSNILLTESGEPLLADFGIAKLVESDESTADLTGSGVGIGTPEYMAPEQGIGQVDERSDVYALGVVFYEMVTGRKPYTATTPMAVLIKKSTEPLPRPSLLSPGLPQTVENVLLKALARVPSERYANMADFSRALERIAEGASTADESTSFAPTKQTGSRQPWLALGAIGAGLFTVCAIGVVLALAWQFISKNPQTGDAPPTGAFPASQTPWDPDIPGASKTPTPTFVEAREATITPTLTHNPSPAQNIYWIAFNSRNAGNADIYIIKSNGSGLRQLTTRSSHELYPSWSPDGEYIIYQTNNGGDQELEIINVTTGETRALTKNECDDFGPHWSPDGEWIVFYSNCDGESGSREIYKIRANGNERQQLTFTSSQNNWFPSWSPDGKKITFSSNRAGSKYSIYVMNADGSDVRQLALGCVSYFSPDNSQILYGVYCVDTDELRLMNADGSNQRAITSGYECKNAAWSRDGLRIAFQESSSGKDGPFRLWIMDLNASEPSNWFLLTENSINGGSPAWQP